MVLECRTNDVINTLLARHSGWKCTGMRMLHGRIVLMMMMMATMSTRQQTMRIDELQCLSFVLPIHGRCSGRQCGMFVVQMCAWSWLQLKKMNTSYCAGFFFYTWLQDEARPTKCVIIKTLKNYLRLFIKQYNISIKIE